MITDSSELHLSTRKVIESLRKHYAGVPLIALGQTVFWDEPVKAVIRRILDLLDPERRMILGVHDTDYFAKAPGRVHGETPFAIVPHNDGSTRELWAAAGEIACLFGCEVVPTREILYDYGVLLDKIAKHLSVSQNDLVDTATEAWGWRGLVRLGTRDVLAMDVQLSEVLPALLEMLDWGFSQTCQMMKCPAGKYDALLREWITAFAAENPDASLSRLYIWLLPKLYTQLLGEEPRNVEVSCSGVIFRFNTETAGLPRFSFVDLFLRPDTRQVCATAYNEALISAETYTLDRFGHGAIPFDLVVPGRGRGTIRVLPDHVSIDLPQPEHIPTEIPVESVVDLAKVVESRFGTDVALVGKAIALINMISSEFMLVFHTFGSPYVTRTRQMNQMIASQGINLKLNPILRLGHCTWDTMGAFSAVLKLPEHLSEAFAKEEITTEEFSRRWTSVVREQEMLLQTLQAITSPRDLILFLQEAMPDHWASLYQEYIAARKDLHEIGVRSEELNTRIDSCYEKMRELKDLIERQEASKGLYYREHIRPLQEQLREMSQKGMDTGSEAGSIRKMLDKHESVRADLGAEIAGHREAVRTIQNEVNELKRQMRELERGEEAIRLRKTIARVEGEAQAARLQLVRRAFLTCKYLPFTNFRPAAWWFSAIDPSNQWFTSLTRKAELYLENLLGDSPQRHKDTE